jgi:hypothetical protein
VLACSPTITAQPANVNQCGNGGANFTVTATNATTYQWQYNNSGTWTSVSGADFSGATTVTLNVANALTYDGRQFRVLVSNAACSTAATSNTVTLSAKAGPSAVFNTSGYICGTGARNVQIDLTGTPPWSVTYTTTLIMRLQEMLR